MMTERREVNETPAHATPFAEPQGQPNAANATATTGAHGVPLPEPASKASTEHERLSSNPPEDTSDPRGYRQSSGFTDNDNTGERESRRRFERLMGETLRRTLERGLLAGLETLSKTDKAIRGVVDDVRFPKEFASFVLGQVDETRKSVVRVAAREIREFLQATDLANEMQRLLTSLSFEIRTEVRFIPNEAGTGIKPSVRTATVSRRRDSNKPPQPVHGSEPPQTPGV